MHITSKQIQLEKRHILIMLNKYVGLNKYFKSHRPFDLLKQQPLITVLTEAIGAADQEEGVGARRCFYGIDSAGCRSARWDLQCECGGQRGHEPVQLKTFKKSSCGPLA